MEPRELIELLLSDLVMPFLTVRGVRSGVDGVPNLAGEVDTNPAGNPDPSLSDQKSTRLNSSHWE